MTAPAYPRLGHRYTFAEYLALERESDCKFEYFDGEITAMTGGTRRHAVLAFEVGYQLRRQLEDKPCEVCSADMRVRSKASGLATYPDVTVLCGPPEMDPEDPEETTLLNPSLVVEVTSKWSEKGDRAEKLVHYRTIPSLHTIIVVSQREKLVEIHERDTDLGGAPSASSWRLMRTVTDGGAGLAWIGVTIDVEALYAGPRRAR